jgi:hypothetical protein
MQSAQEYCCKKFTLACSLPPFFFTLAFLDMFWVHVVSYILKQTWCLSICVFVTDIRRLRPGQPLRGAGRGATTFYTSNVDAWCNLGPNGALSRPDGGAQGTKGGPNRLEQCAQDLQGRLTVSEGHGYPLVCFEQVMSTRGGCNMLHHHWSMLWMLGSMRHVTWPLAHATWHVIWPLVRVH